MTLLLVDDHTLLRQALLRAFSLFKHPYKLLEASNGEEALTIIKNQQVDIMLLDV